MKILITGGFGYLGGRLGQYLANESSNQIYLGTRIKKKSPRWCSSAVVVETNWQDPESLSLSTKGIDTVIHTAGMNAKDCADNPELALAFNGGATAALLDAAVKNNVKRFIYLSTAHVYSSPLSGIITENLEPKNKHSYATSHLAGELELKKKIERKEIEGVSIRLSNSFGAPTDVKANCWMLLANDLCKQGILKNKMILNSSGNQRRDFIALSEVCRAINYLINLESDKIGDGLFNLGGEWCPTIKEMTELIASRVEVITNTRPQVEYKQEGNELVPPFKYDISKLVATGFVSNQDKNVTGEIDNLINFCIRNKESF